MQLQQTSSFQQSFQEFMFYAGPIIQILFWIIVAGSILYAVIQFKRLVDAQVAESEAVAAMMVEAEEEYAAESKVVSAAEAAAEKISAEEFTE